MSYRYHTSECMPRLYPVVVYRGVLNLGDDLDSQFIHRGNFMRGEWGDATDPTIIDDNTYPLPNGISMKWGAITERKAYALEAPLDKDQIEELWQQQDNEGVPLYEFIVVGIAPYGKVAVWLHGTNKSTMLKWMNGVEIDEQEVKQYLMGLSLKQYCQLSIDQNEVIKTNLRTHGLPAPDLYDRWMQQYHYRYVVLEEYYDGKSWQRYEEADLYYDDLEVDSVEDYRFDGTHDQLRDGGLMTQHVAGCPKRIIVKWQEGWTNFAAYYWLDENAAPQAFHRFFMFNADGRVDLLMRIDTRTNHYGIALKSNELPMIQEISDEVYQLLVFRNGYEYFRSKNYSQPEGAWQW